MLPIAPVEGVIWLAEQLEKQAAEQLYGTDAVLAELDRINSDLDRGLMTRDEHAASELVLLDRLESSMPTNDWWNC